jgi:D-2-hydroxyacid dehydrogenase (NADP+)
MSKIVVLLNSPESVQQAYRDGIRAADADAQVDVVNDVDRLGAYLAEMEVLMTFGPFLRDRADYVFANAPRLRWIQALGSGVDNLVPKAGLRDDVVVANIRGTQDAAVSEATIAAMLALSRDLPRSMKNQERQEWDRYPSRLLEGKTVGILGVGLIAVALARRCKAFEMKVIGITSRTGAIDPFDELRPRDALPAAVSDLDFLVVLAPYTAENHHLVSRAVLSALKPTACLVNVARGGLIDEAALIEALERGNIAGAALDVFAAEPLPRGHRLWSLPNVIVTPHTAGMNVDSVKKAMPAIQQNVRAFRAGNIAGMAGVVRLPKPATEHPRH